MYKARHTGHHIHPSGNREDEYVAYETVDGKWNVFVLGSPDIRPEPEGSRIDDEHIFIETIEPEDELDHVAESVD